MLRKPEQDPIEGYLGSVRRYLGAMPADEAAAALEEMRSHLRAAISELVANGAEEEQAIADVLKRFGSPRTVGQAIAKASLNAWLVEVDKREGIFVSRSLKAAMFFSNFGIMIIAYSFMLMMTVTAAHHHTPLWVLPAVFFLGLLGGNLEVIVMRSARQRLAPRKRLQELSLEYAALAKACGLRARPNNPVFQETWYSYFRESPTSKFVLLMIINGGAAAWVLHLGGRDFANIPLYNMGQAIGDYFTGRTGLRHGRSANG